MFKRIGIWVAIAAAWGIAFAAKEAFEIPEYWMWLAVVAVIGILVSFNFEGRLQALEARVVHRDYSGILKQLDGERHKPEHKQPESLAAGGAIKSFINPAHEILFEDFRWFAAVLNRHVSHPWSIEELNDTSVRGYDSPEVGRRYQVWYNACMVGTVQVTAGNYSIARPETFADDRKARVDLELSYLRFISYRDARSLISQIVLFVGGFDFENIEASHAKAAAEAADALGGYLWEAVRQSDIDPFFEYRVDGPYELLRHTTDHWKSNGLDPFKEWGGDRPKQWS